jgi:hypothetical protein
MIRILLEADLHCGNSLGIGNPEHWPERKRKAAQTVWDWRRERLREIGRVDIHVLGGDLIDGPGKKGTLGLLTTDIEEQAEMAEEVIREVRADYRYFTYGTPFHTVSVLDGENLVARAFRTKPLDEQRLGPFHGRRLLDRHVLGRSDIPYGALTPLWKEWVQEQLRALLEEYRAADIHTRHHVHYNFLVSNGRSYAISCPCWEIPRLPSYSQPYPRTLKTQYYDMGMMLIEIDRTGEVFVRPQLMPLKLTSPRRYECPPIKGNT